MLKLELAEDWDEAERRWIARLRGDGCPLANIAVGGKSNDHMQASPRSPTMTGHQTPLQWARNQFSHTLRLALKIGDEEMIARARRRIALLHDAANGAIKREGRTAAIDRINAELVARGIGPQGAERPGH